MIGFDLVSSADDPKGGTEENMKKLFVAVLFATGIAGIGSAQAWDGCGVGCHATWRGQCVVDGWETATPIARNQCPVGTIARSSCPFGYVWRPRSHACFALN
jgi:hypothetical protein